MWENSLKIDMQGNRNYDNFLCSLQHVLNGFNTVKLTSTY